jgi:hypothetical protein
LGLTFRLSAPVADELAGQIRAGREVAQHASPPARDVCSVPHSNGRPTRDFEHDQATSIDVQRSPNRRRHDEATPVVHTDGVSAGMAHIGNVAQVNTSRKPEFPPLQNI